MTNPKYSYKNIADVKFQVKNIGKPFVTYSKPTHFEKRYRENLDYNSYVDHVSKTGKIIFGGAGYGKTYKICDLIYEHNDNCLVFSHTNKAVVNIKNRQKRMKNTFESFFYDNIKGVDDLKDKIVFVDEYSMTPNRYITLLYQAFTKYDITIIMSGDTNQCEPINNTKSIRHNYFDDSISVSEMCPRRRKLEYIEESARYDNETRLVLERVLKYKNIRHKFEPIGNYYKNICWLNETRQKVTEDCCNRFVQDKEYYDINFKYKSRIEKYKVCVKMPIIATQNMKKRDMFNMMEFNIDNIIENDEGNLEFEINNETFSLNEFRESFLPNFCNTVYKYQGGKIDEHYNIWDTHKMDVKEMYTALSRTKKLEYIHLDKKNYVVDTKKESKTT